MNEKERVYSELLAIKLLRKDHAALNDLIRLWEKRLFYFIRRLVSSEEDTWDTLQEVWIKVVKGIGKLENTSSLIPWLYRIAHNTAMDNMRNRYSEIKTEEITGEIEETYHEEDPSFENAELVHRGLTLISIPHREVLTLHFLEDFTLDEIAGILNIPQGTVKSRIHYAKRELREVIMREDFK